MTCVKPPFFLLLILLKALGFNNPEDKKQSIENAKWLIGTWENKTSKGSFYEEWLKVSNTEFAGKSYFIKKSDTLVFETIRIIESNDSIFYIPQVSNQNKGLPVPFLLLEMGDTSFTFENLNHDFPQRIAYIKLGSDSLVAVISGIANGVERKNEFRMKRL